MKLLAALLTLSLSALPSAAHAQAKNTPASQSLAAAGGDQVRTAERLQGHLRASNAALDKETAPLQARMDALHKQIEELNEKANKAFRQAYPDDIRRMEQDDHATKMLEQTVRAENGWGPQWVYDMRNRRWIDTSKRH